jgi:hypothetical protein
VRRSERKSEECRGQEKMGGHKREYEGLSRVVSQQEQEEQEETYASIETFLVIEKPSLALRNVASMTLGMSRNTLNAFLIVSKASLALWVTLGINLSTHRANSFWFHD